MSDVYEIIGKKIRDLRRSYGGTGISQERLAVAVGTTANTVSRWETAAYKPSVRDLEKLARFFDVSIGDFFPDESHSPDKTARLNALMSATGNLRDDELDELLEYARFRAARRKLARTSKGTKRSER